MSTRLRRGFLPFLLVAALGVAAGCGDDDEEDSGSATPAAETTADAGSAKDKFAADVAELSKRPTSINIDEPIKGEIEPGKTIAYLQCAFPDCVQIGDELDRATKKVGWKMLRINAGATPETVKASWQEALRRSPDGIAQTGSPVKDYYKAELAQAIEKKIPLVGLAELEQGEPWIVSIGSGEGQGRIQSDMVAKYVASKIDEGKLLRLDVPGIGIIEEQSKNFEAKITEYCTTCEVDKLDIPATSLGKDSPKRIASHLQANPGYKFMYIPTIDLALGLNAALTSAGVEPVPIVAQSTTPAGLDALAKGEAGLEATAAYPNAEGAFKIVDAFARHFSGQDPSVDSDENAAQWLITQDNVTDERPLPAVKDFEQRFYELWGVE